MPLDETRLYSLQKKYTNETPSKTKINGVKRARNSRDHNRLEWIRQLAHKVHRTLKWHWQQTIAGPQECR